MAADVGQWEWRWRNEVRSFRSEARSVSEKLSAQAPATSDRVDLAREHGVAVPLALAG